MKDPGTTPPFRGPDGEVPPGSIADISYIPLGGVDQWVMIRGENVANPVLVLCHGGSGFPEMRLFRHFNADLEQVFTVVYWDQHGTDKSLIPALSRASMTVEQFLRDSPSECLWPEASSLNVVKAVPSLEMPVFLVIERRDHVIDAGESAAYFDVLIAPAKILVWFEESAHEPPAEVNSPGFLGGSNR
jgi:hypothetical protein